MARMCEVCRQPIDPDRAEAIPETRLCTEHAREIQAYGGEFVLTGTQEKTSKDGSMKKNYGDVATKKTRNHVAIGKLKAAVEKRCGP